MTKISKKVGRPRGAGRVTEAERDVIRLSVFGGVSADDIAKIIGRGRATIYNQITRLERDRTISQGVMPLGQVEGLDP